MRRTLRSRTDKHSKTTGTSFFQSARRWPFFPHRRDISPRRRVLPHPLKQKKITFQESHRSTFTPSVCRPGRSSAEETKKKETFITGRTVGPTRLWRMDTHSRVVTRPSSRRNVKYSAPLLLPLLLQPRHPSRPSLPPSPSRPGFRPTQSKVQHNNAAHCGHGG